MLSRIYIPFALGLNIIEYVLKSIYSKENYCKNHRLKFDFFTSDFHALIGQLLNERRSSKHLKRDTIGPLAKLMAFHRSVD